MYDFDRTPIFDGLASEKAYERLYGSGNKVGAWILGQVDQNTNAIPGTATHLSTGNLPQGTPIRLSISARNRFGVGGAEQIEIRLPNNSIGDIFSKWTTK